VCYPDDNVILKRLGWTGGKRQTGVFAWAAVFAISMLGLGQTAAAQGLRGYISCSLSQPPVGFGAGLSFYSAVWSLIEKPLNGFQIGLPSTWIIPDNSDNATVPLCPVGTTARKWPERGPTWASVFQTVEGGLGYWAGTRFHYGPPKFSMNGTPNCYDDEIASPGWGFFRNAAALPDSLMGIAQLSNRILVPPDGLPFQGNPEGLILGYAWMALPFTDPKGGSPPTGDQSWTLFVNSANFKGPVAYYIPETWSKISKGYPFDDGRGLDARPGIAGGGAIEINTVPYFTALDSRKVLYSRIPRLRFPVDGQGRTILVQDVKFYSNAALHDRLKAWRAGGAASGGTFDTAGAMEPAMTTRPTAFTQDGKSLTNMAGIVETRIFSPNVFGLQWHANPIADQGFFPEYFRDEMAGRVAIPPSQVPSETNLSFREFSPAQTGTPYTSPSTGAWIAPGPARGPYQATLADFSKVTYYWYRFVDQPAFQQFGWSEVEKALLQSLVEKIHAGWPIDRNYIPPPSGGALAAFDPALIVIPPAGCEVGYVPIVTGQERVPQPPAVPTNAQIQRIAVNYGFFKVYTNRLTWQANTQNSVDISSYRIYRKAKDAAESAWSLFVDLPGSSTTYDDRGLRKDQLFFYRITAVSSQGFESDPVAIGN